MMGIQNLPHVQLIQYNIKEGEASMSYFYLAPPNFSDQSHLFVIPVVSLLWKTSVDSADGLILVLADCWHNYTYIYEKLLNIIHTQQKLCPICDPELFGGDGRSLLPQGGGVSKTRRHVNCTQCGFFRIEHMLNLHFWRFFRNNTFLSSATFSCFKWAIFCIFARPKIMLPNSYNSSSCCLLFHFARH